MVFGLGETCARRHWWSERNRRLEVWERNAGYVGGIGLGG